MKFTRLTPVFLALIVLLMASLACAALSPKPTEAPAATQVVPDQAPAEAPFAEPTATPKPTQGEIVLEEDFSDNANKWYVGQDDDGENTLEDGKYKVTLTSFGSYFWFNAPVSISEADLTVDTEFTAGAPENIAYGFLCHFTDDKNHYRIKVAPDGYYAIDKTVNGEISETNLQGWNFTSAMTTGLGAVNRVRVVCSENHITLYINDQLVSDVVDSEITGGTFALMVSSAANKEDDKNPVSMNFSNLVVRKALPWQAPAESLMRDSFADNQNDWKVYDNEGKASTQIENDQMLFKVVEAGSYFWVYPGVTFSNVDVAFDVTPREGTVENVSYGALCRFVDRDNLYLFEVSADGQYKLAKTFKGESTDLVEWTVSEVIKTGLDATNRVRVVCSGPNLEMYVNDQLLISVQDSTLTAGGFALQAGRFTTDDKPVSVSFDNLEVYYPQK